MCKITTLIWACDNETRRSKMSAFKQSNWLYNITNNT